ncbi:MAG: DEAD/DEAH box helicase [Verrucomicrobia bacterium]|nr:DEAD/DEAH box helicase [Verrucomicrobiota bacterium]
MITDFTEEEIFRSSSKEELKRLAARGQLIWKGKKIVLDPFTGLEFFYRIVPAGEKYAVHAKMKMGSREEDLSSCEAVFAKGALQHSIFRFWKEDIDPQWLQSRVLDLLELKELIEKPDVPQLIWDCPVPRFKPDPLPILKLKDRTGAFASLWMDYGLQGKHPMKGTPEEIFWEKDLLETDFMKKIVGESHYYCPMDKVVKSLTFLLDVGWTIIDAQGKKVVRQGAADWAAVSQVDHVLVKGKVAYGQHAADVKNVIGAFNRRDRFVNLSESDVGLLDFPAEWTALAEEEIVAEGIAVKRHHVGLLEDITPLPPEYQAAAWEEVLLSDNFLGKLFDYQRKGVQWLSYLFRSRFGGLLADEMGLGKTIQVLAFLSTLKITQPVLIVMPVSLLFNWKKEFEKFVPSLQVYVHRGEDRLLDLEKLKEQKVILTSYAQLRIDRLLLESMDFEALILDEAQAIKNPDSLTAQIACRLRSPFRLALTGTPVENRYEDLWSLFRFLMPTLLGERKEAPVLERVRKKIRPFTLRRTKIDVNLQLPEKQEQMVWIGWDEDQRSFYDQYLKEKRNALVQKVQAQGISSQKMEILELILRIRQICCHPQLVSGEYAGESAKFERVCNDLEEAISTGHKILLYSQFTSVLGFFRKWMEEKNYSYAYLDGQTQDREKAVELFRSDPNIQVFLMSLKAGGVGLNLQVADYVFLYDPWWNEAAERQAIDRAHRVGQKNKVIARKYLMAESIEEKILKLQGVKQSLSENLLEFEGEIQPISLEDLYTLLETI